MTVRTFSVVLSAWIFSRASVVCVARSVLIFRLSVILLFCIRSSPLFEGQIFWPLVGFVYQAFPDVQESYRCGQKSATLNCTKSAYSRIFFTPGAKQLACRPIGIDFASAPGATCVPTGVGSARMSWHRFCWFPLVRSGFIIKKGGILYGRLYGVLTIIRRRVWYNGGL